MEVEEQLRQERAGRGVKGRQGRGRDALIRVEGPIIVNVKAALYGRDLEASPILCP